MTAVLVRPGRADAPGGDGPDVRVVPGPVLLRAVADGPSLAVHREHRGSPASLSGDALVAATARMSLRGRGGAGFPFARKLAAVQGARGRSSVVVNLSEGEPASSKDATLALVAPHLVLDGAAACARALGARTVHVVVPGERPAVERAVRRAVDERSADGRRPAWQVHVASPWFVAGQARAVIELMAGRENLPVTAWQPEAYGGHRGRPTLLSNAETFAHVGALVTEGPGVLGTADEPGTTLLTLRGDTDRPTVVEVPYGTSWSQVLTADELDRPVLLGGYHGTWAPAGRLTDLPVSPAALRAGGLTLGAGVVLPLPSGTCPLHRTTRIVAYLAGQSAGRCGPCLNGLPALADALRLLDEGAGSAARVRQLVDLVVGRGACAHPDGTARLVSSLLDHWGDEPAAHLRGACAERRAALVTGDAR